MTLSRSARRRDRGRGQRGRLGGGGDERSMDLPWNAWRAHARDLALLDRYGDRGALLRCRADGQSRGRGLFPVHSVQSLRRRQQDRKSVVQGKRVSVGVDLGGREIINKTRRV